MDFVEVLKLMCVEFRVFHHKRDVIYEKLLKVGNFSLELMIALHRGRFSEHFARKIFLIVNLLNRLKID